MNKTIEKIEAYKEKEIEKALTKAQTEYDEARDSYNDTGYDKYFNKMSKCEKIINELKDYKCLNGSKDISTAEYKEYYKMKKDLETLKNKFFYLVSDFGLPATADVIGIQEMLRDY